MFQRMEFVTVDSDISSLEIIWPIVTIDVYENRSQFSSKREEVKRDTLKRLKLMLMLTWLKN